MPAYDATIGAASHAAGAALFGLLLALLLTAWRGRLCGALLVGVCVASFLWCLDLAGAYAHGPPFARAGAILEAVRDGAWFLFLAGLLGWRLDRGSLRGHTPLGRAAAASVLACVLVAAVASGWEPGGPGTVEGARPEWRQRLGLIGFLVLAVVGLAWVEQVFRNAAGDRRWALKPLCIGIGGLFAYDFYLYAHGALLGSLDPWLLQARGAVNALVVPFLAVAAARNPEWSVEIFVSRQVVFHSAALMGAGLYLIGMAAVGYYIRIYGGTWGTVLQILFLCGAAALLVLLLSSGWVRANLRVFVGKHFFRNKYEYREEWLRFTRTLSTSRDDAELCQNIVRGIAQIVESRAGVMWARRQEGAFVPASQWNVGVPEEAAVAADDPLVRFLGEREWVVSLREYREEPGLYPGLELPPALAGLERGWLVPLKERDELLGFIVLAESISRRRLDWEDCDLLKTVGRQAASYLALMEATEALASSRQFEAFNRLSAFVVHDLKNVAAQLSLVTANARRHRQDPAFVADAMATVESATARMNRMLAHLRNERNADTSSRLVNVGLVVRKAVAACALARPVPAIGRLDEGAIVLADPERLASVLEHLIQNAQEATPETGRVEVRAGIDAERVFVDVEDDGAGMDARFVSERLFRPFDTTKGNAGMGIGVYEAREFVRGRGGDLEVETAPGRGSRFRLWFPVESADERDAAGAATVKEAAL